MPVQINEMIIRANVVESDEKAKEPAAKATGSTDINKEEIVKECVEVIMEILNNKNQR